MLSTSVANSAAQEGSIITSCLSFVAYARSRKRLVSLDRVVVALRCQCRQPVRSRDRARVSTEGLGSTR
jgi:hypothetical protein